jgi:hypothetical protein
MSTSFARMATAVIVAVLAALALVGVSGMIVFADLTAPKASQLAAEALSKAPIVRRVQD